MVACLSSCLLFATTACESDPSNDDESAAEGGEHEEGPVWSCEQDPRFVPFAIGMAAQGSQTTASFLSANPPEPVIGKNHWKLRFADLQGVPLVGLSIKASTWMPDHNHASPSDAGIIVTADPLIAGDYSFDQIDMHMAGFWEIRFNITYPDNSIDEIQFTLCHNP